MSDDTETRAPVWRRKARQTRRSGKVDSTELMEESRRSERALTGPVLGTFLYYVVPSLIGLFAISTASIVDGIFVGRFVGSTALAAINLLIPYFTLLFGTALMLAVGGAIRAGKYLGEGNAARASSVFGKVVFGTLAFSACAAVLSTAFDETLYRALGAPATLFHVLRSYFRIIAFALILQLVTLVVYYFVRLDGRPVLATGALVVGAFANIGLDALFVIQLEWGLPGAALATALAQLLQLGVLLTHFSSQQNRLSFSFSFVQSDWAELPRSAFNGSSEFVNEVSAGGMMLVLNWVMIQRVGVHGVAAFSVVNYAVLASLMAFYGVADALHVLLSQNLGAGNAARIRGFMRSAVLAVTTLSGVIFSALWTFAEQWSSLFVGAAASRLVLDEAASFLRLVSPLFLVNGLNVVFTVYLASMQRSLSAGLVALCRSLILPVSFLLALSSWLPGQPFLVALPLAEWTTFVLGLILCIRFPPESCVQAELRSERQALAS